jgi:hypothetical protein
MAIVEHRTLGTIECVRSLRARSIRLVIHRDGTLRLTFPLFSSRAKAIAFAAEKHRDQTRKDDTPYIYHPMQVAEMVKNAGYGIKYQVVAILHDILEDTDATEAEVLEFGEDILIAVKLLTRADGANEDDYVDAILQNHMASVVKNADKIDNMWGAAYCEDKQWAKKYVKKAKLHYEGKFSYALDRSIGHARAALSVLNPTKEVPCYTPNEMQLYSDREIEVYNNCKYLYECCINWPTHSNPSIQYWHNELGNYHFCVLDNAVWKLSKAGWLPRAGNPIEESEYGDELRQMSRNEIVEWIENQKMKNYFYDFVDKSTL